MIGVCAGGEKGWEERVSGERPEAVEGCPSEADGQQEAGGGKKGEGKKKNERRLRPRSGVQI